MEQNGCLRENEIVIFHSLILRSRTYTDHKNQLFPLAEKTDLLLSGT